MVSSKWLGNKIGEEAQLNRDEKTQFNRLYEHIGLSTGYCNETPGGRQAVEIT